MLPRYDLAQRRVGIVHLGLGGFHRAHMARYTHALMQQDPAALRWSIAGAGLLPSDRRMAESLGPQDGLYTLVERSGSGETVSVIGSIARVIYAGDSSDRAAGGDCGSGGAHCQPDRHRERLLPQSRDTAVRPRSCADPRRPCGAEGATQRDRHHRRSVSAADAGAATGVHGAELRQHPAQRQRVARGGAHVGTAARSGAGRRGSRRAAAFPNTMVDRITPVTAASDIEYLERSYGIADRWPVVCEDFTQWVIEDRFVAGRPEWEAVGAQFVPDVTPYEMMKLRLLNGSHLAVAALGRLAGYTYIHETMQDASLRGLMAALMDRETGPTLPPVPGIDLGEYKRTLIARFANPAIRDTVERVNTDAPLNVLVVPIMARLEMNGSVDLLALSLAGWIRRVRGVDEAGQPIDIRHPLADVLRRKAEEGGPDPAPVLSITQLFGSLGDDARLVVPLRHWLGSLYQVGARRTLALAAEELGF